MFRKLFILLFLTSCSVSNAITGQKMPDFDKIYIGVDKARVEEIMGKPEKSVWMGKGERVYVYKYKDPNPSLPLVIGNTLADTATVGLWELVDYKGSKYHNLYVTYDKDWRVSSLNDYI